MVTRAQAAKRKAEDDPPGPPSKSSKSSNSESGSAGSEDGLLQADGPSKVQISGTNEPEDEQQSSASEGPSEKGRENRHTQAEAEQSPPSAGNDREPPIQPSAPDAARTQQMEDARGLISQLRMVAERSSVDRGGYALRLEAEKQCQSFAEICERAMAEGIQRNVFLKFLPPEWFAQVQRLKQSIEESRKREKDFDEAVGKLTECIEAYEEATARRGDSLLGIGDCSVENKALLNKKFEDACNEMRQARLEAKRLRDRRNAQDNDEYQISTALVRTTRERLLSKGYLVPPRETATNRVESAGSQQAARAAQRSSRSADHHAASNPRPLRSRRGSNERDDGPQRTSERQNVVASLRKTANQDLEDCRACFNDAADKFEEVRAKYYGELFDFLERKRNGVEDGTRTEFDLCYYLDRSKANHDLAVAMDELDYYIIHADRAGALSVSERIRDLDDERARSYGESADDGVTRMVDDLAREAVDEWLFDDRQDDTRSEQHWPSMLPPLSEGAFWLDSLSALENRNGLAGNFEGRRKQIDDYGEVQERLRRTFAHVDPYAPRTEVELQWFEGWGGL